MGSAPYPPELMERFAQRAMSSSETPSRSGVQLREPIDFSHVEYARRVLQREGRDGRPKTRKRGQQHKVAPRAKSVEPVRERAGLATVKELGALSSPRIQHRARTRSARNDSRHRSAAGPTAARAAYAKDDTSSDSLDEHREMFERDLYVDLTRKLFTDLPLMTRVRGKVCHRKSFLATDLSAWLSSKKLCFNRAECDHVGQKLLEYGHIYRVDDPSCRMFLSTLVPYRFADEATLGQPLQPLAYFRLWKAMSLHKFVQLSMEHAAATEQLVLDNAYPARHEESSYEFSYDELKDL
eukprot:CAMPEP_0185831162 /NCGR_PEP_ID=MMETSP1353-20130828/1322_1 /TAXON_ID=1077150 /ORGANISM="Erythrolobus australicus, Strain CCMP3124" /LENGTH=295 /DNA_ID=CAMNT_0028529195 /DNA_START=783 /DNA_END=1670 /DNA_ORIENTATION=-